MSEDNELRRVLREWFIEWMWCRENGVKKSKWNICGCDINLYEMEKVNRRLVIERNLVVCMRWWLFDKIKVMELLELSDLIYKGNGGSFSIGGESINDKWKEWRFIIEKDEENDEDGFSIDYDERCCWFVINGSLIREGN